MSSGERFDLAVLGAGPGGYVAAIRAAQLGRKVAVIEEERPGGVCLNWGCIPTKALLQGAELIEALRTKAATFGITASGIELDYGKAIDHSRKTSDRLCKGIEALFKKNQIELVSGRGRLTSTNEIAVAGKTERSVQADHLVLATGSLEWVPPGVEVDGQLVMTSREALLSKRIPERLVVIGAGAVGIEFAYIYANYGSKVTVVEMADQILPGADPDVADALQREFRRKKIELRIGTRFERVEKNGGGARVIVSQDGQEEALDAEQVLMAIGRKPRSADLGLAAAGIELDERGFVKTDEALRSSAASVFAIGDLAGGPLLAHKASEEGSAAAEFMAGIERRALDHRRIPACIYCQPQVAWIGLTEAKAREEYGDVRVGKFPFLASGKAVATAHTAGFVKVIAEPRHGELVGAHIVGQGATELIAEIGLAMTLESTTSELANTSHAHPTLSEAIMEAALAAEGRAIHF